MTGPIRGTRLSAEVKRFIVRAVTDAKAKGMPISRSCAILMVDPRRVRRWVAGCDPHALTETDLTDAQPIAKICPHAITPAERAEIVTAAKDKRLAHLRHRKLTHTLSRQARVYCSPSTTLRVLQAEDLVPVYHHRSRPSRPRPVTDESQPNKTWRYDFLTFPTRAGDYHLVPVLDACSRKITGRYFGPEQTSSAVHDAWDKAPLLIVAAAAAGRRGSRDRARGPAPRRARNLVDAVPRPAPGRCGSESRSPWRRPGSARRIPAHNRAVTCTETLFQLLVVSGITLLVWSRRPPVGVTQLPLFCGQVRVGCALRPAARDLFPARSRSRSSSGCLGVHLGRLIHPAIRFPRHWRRRRHGFGCNLTHVWTRPGHATTESDRRRPKQSGLPTWTIQQKSSKNPAVPARKSDKEPQQAASRVVVASDQMKRLATVVGLILTLALLLAGCDSNQDPDLQPAGDAPRQDEAEDQEGQPKRGSADLAQVCSKAFNLIETHEPGTVSRKRAVALANEAFFIDSSPEVNEAFSNLNNVYVYDDGTSTDIEVRNQLDAVCP